MEVGRRRIRPGRGGCGSRGGPVRAYAVEVAGTRAAEGLSIALEPACRLAIDRRSPFACSMSGSPMRTASSGRPSR